MKARINKKDLEIVGNSGFDFIKWLSNNSGFNFPESKDVQRNGDNLDFHGF